MIWLKSNKSIKPLAYPYYYFTVLIVAFVGLGDAVYLAISHYRVFTDIGYQSFCAISRALNCDTVSQSPYAILTGVPVPVWGIWGYGFFMTLLAFAWPKKAMRKRVWTLLFLISLGFSIYSLILAFISTFYIKSYCIMCILSYGVNLLLLFFTWLIRNRFHCEPISKAIVMDIRYLATFPKAMGGVLTILAAGTALMLLFFPTYWKMHLPGLSDKISTGITQEVHPWIGAEDPILEIVEFSDYQCFQCRKMHFFLRRMIQAHPDKIRLVHRHFPMDHTVNPLVKQPFYTGSGRLALVALAAAKTDRFWEMNDVLFDISKQTGAVNIRDLSQKAGIAFDEISPLLQNKQLWHKLKQDIQAGLDYKLTGTPGFVINETVYMGQIPADVFRKHGLSRTEKAK
jgi:uncharacterized membrane protein/predicted DsbA family dithiol-disulfide isomerase